MLVLSAPVESCSPPCSSICHLVGDGEQPPRVETTLDLQTTSGDSISLTGVAFERCDQARKKKRDQEAACAGCVGFSSRQIANGTQKYCVSARPLRRTKKWALAHRGGLVVLALPDTTWAVTPESPEVRQIIDRGLDFLENNSAEARLGGRALIGLAPTQSRARQRASPSRRCVGSDAQARPCPAASSDAPLLEKHSCRDVCM